MEEKRKAYMLAVEKAYSKVPHFISKTPSTEDYLHILQVASSVMMTRDKFMPGGSFVKAIVDNDLRAAFGRADSVSTTAIKFFVYVNDNVFLVNDNVFLNLNSESDSVI